jgi:hypothetical protein
MPFRYTGIFRFAGTSPLGRVSSKGSPTLILNTNPNRVAVEIDVFVYATEFSNCPT